MKTQNATNETNAPKIGESMRVVDESHDLFGEIGTIVRVNKSTIRLEFEDGEATLKPEQLELDDGETEGSKMSQTLAKYRQQYVVSVSGNGRKSKACGDDLSKLLEGKDHKYVASLADRVFEEPEGFHMAKYEHLNNGQIRMNSGNRIRAAIKRGDVTFEEVKALTA